MEKSFLVKNSAGGLTLQGDDLKVTRAPQRFGVTNLKQLVGTYTLPIQT